MPDNIYARGERDLGLWSNKKKKKALDKVIEYVKELPDGTQLSVRDALNYFGKDSLEEENPGCFDDPNLHHGNNQTPVQQRKDERICSGRERKQTD